MCSVEEGAQDPLTADMLTVPEVAQYLRIGKSEAYALAARGELPVLRIGRRVIVPRDELTAWIQERLQPAQAPRA